MRKRFAWANGLIWICTSCLCVLAQDEAAIPPFAAVRQTVELHFARRQDRMPGDLLSHSDVVRVLAEVEKLGWKIEDARELADSALPDSHVLVATFRTPAGRKFMRQVAERPLIYDRLDRISQVSGGSQLVRDIVKLPDGERYAKPQSGAGVPDLLDLLPKAASGRTRQIRDYHQPTGRIYTAADLLKRLEESHRKAQSKKA